MSAASRAMKTAAILAVALIASPATVHADDSVPTVDQVLADMAELTDPNIPAINKGNVVTPGFSPEEAGTIDDHLRQMNGAGMLPLPFVVTDIEPAPNNFAGATLATTGSFHQTSAAKPIVLVEHNGRWLLTHDSAMTAMDAFWINATRQPPGAPPLPDWCTLDNPDPACHPVPPHLRGGHAF
jgi:hypothetical protein